MSPKERARVAQREQEESRTDGAYQAKMAEGETLFQQDRYEEAMALFEEARILRPLNVYPKVKIEDLKVLIRQRDERNAAEKDGSEVPQPPHAVDTGGASALPDQPAPVAVKAPEAGPLEVFSPNDRVPPPADSTTTTPASLGGSDPAPVRKQMTRTMQAPRTEPAEALPPTPTPPPPDGVVENRYKQGSAQVTEMMVTQNGRTTVFKRVAHKYGQVYYFEDGQAIDGRVWRERFGHQP